VRPPGDEPALPAGAACPSGGPRRRSNGRFFDAWRGPIWQLNATAFGHTDICNFASAANGMLCPANGDAAQVADYQSTAAAVVAAFVRGLLGADPFAQAIDLLTGTAKAPIAIEYAQRNVPATPASVAPGCTHDA
jgi:hypothetical protein